MKINISLYQAPVWAPRPLKDLSWRELSKKYILTMADPGPIEIDLNIIPDELIEQIKYGLKNKYISTDQVENLGEAQYKKENEAISKATKVLFSEAEAEECNSLLSQNVPLIKRNVDILIDEGALGKLRLLYQLETDGKKRSTVINLLRRAIETTMTVLEATLPYTVNSTIDFAEEPITPS